MSKRIPKYKIEKVEELPPLKRKVAETLYDEIVRDILSKPKGYYMVEVEGRKLKAIYPAIKKRIIRGSLPLKLHVRSGSLFIEKIQ